MNTKFSFRIIIDIFLFIAILNGWWFLAIPLGIFGTWYQMYFIEIIMAGIAYDALFGMSAVKGLDGWIGTIAAIVIYYIIFFSKKLVRR